VNGRIRVPQVRLIAEDGQQVGIVATSDALARAQEKGLDLVEVQATARPPVCRIMDFGKYKYEQAKKDRSARRRQHVMHLKEVKLRPKIEEHDYMTKLGHARDFLQNRDKVKFTLQFRGREIAYPERGRALLARVVEDLADVGAPEGMPRSEGRVLTMTLLPKATKAPIKKASGERPPAGGRGTTAG
jgi:translation initiation factor IF-3